MMINESNAWYLKLEDDSSSVGGRLHLNWNFESVHLCPGLKTFLIVRCTFIAACGAVSSFTLIAKMLMFSGQTFWQQMNKLVGEVSPETNDHCIRNIKGKRFGQYNLGYDGMTAMNFGMNLITSMHVKNMEKFPTHGAAQFRN
jgi:hypothetical protein